MGSAPHNHRELHQGSGWRQHFKKNQKTPFQQRENREAAAGRCSLAEISNSGDCSVTPAGSAPLPGAGKGLPPPRSALTMLSVALSQGLRLRYLRWRSCKHKEQEAGFGARRADLGDENQGRFGAGGAGAEGGCRGPPVPSC